MPVRCLTSSRFSMNAEVLKWTGTTTGDSNDVSQGAWTTFQDPITGEILNTWEPTDQDGGTVDTGDTVKTFSCIARGIISKGLRGAGTTEVFGKDYENIDFVMMYVGARTIITKRDRVTNIRAKKGGHVVWLDEEFNGGTRPTVFNVNGVTPVFDAFNNHIENFVLLERASG